MDDGDEEKDNTAGQTHREAMVKRLRGEPSVPSPEKRKQSSSARGGRVSQGGRGGGFAGRSGRKRAQREEMPAQPEQKSFPTRAELIHAAYRRPLPPTTPAMPRGHVRKESGQSKHSSRRAKDAIPTGPRGQEVGNPLPITTGRDVLPEPNQNVMSIQEAKAYIEKKLGGPNSGAQSARRTDAKKGRSNRGKPAVQTSRSRLEGTGASTIEPMSSASFMEKMRAIMGGPKAEQSEPTAQESQSKVPDTLETEEVTSERSGKLKSRALLVKLSSFRDHRYA